MAQSKRYFRLLDEHGVHAPVLVDGYDNAGNPIEVENPKAGEPGPLINVGVRVLVPVGIAPDGEILQEVVSVEITTDGAYRTVDQPTGRAKRIGLPDSDDKIVDVEGRVLCLTSQKLIDGIVQSGQYEEVDPPKADQARKPKAPASAGQEA